MNKLFPFVFLLLAQPTYANNHDANNIFKIYEALIYDEKPDMSVYGIETLTILNHTTLWNPNNTRNNIPDKETISNLTHGLLKDKEIVVINIEHWPLVGATDSTIEKSINKYVKTLQGFKKEAKSLNVGLYSMIPERNYWAPVSGRQSENFTEWRKRNNILKPIEEEVDIFFPSLYTFYNDKDEWLIYAKAQIEEARRLNPIKPVYVFLWPQYHNSNSKIGLEFISKEFWRMQIETAKKYADGLVIWGGWDFKNNNRLKWNPNAEWWAITKEFAKVSTTLFTKPSTKVSPPTGVSVD